jgi:hypothetical protein
MPSVRLASWPRRRALTAALEALQSDGAVRSRAEDAAEVAARLAGAMQRFRVNGAAQVVGGGTVVLSESSERSK